LKEKVQEKVEWEIDTREIDIVKILNSGSFGDVYKGYYKNNSVAIKILKNSQDADVKEFIKEFTILVNLRSRHIVEFYGATLKFKLCMVMEFCERGSLFNVFNTVSFQLTWENALRFCKEISLGIQALHNCDPPIIHRDLKTHNVLVTHDYTCKIADFGLSRKDTPSNLKSLTEAKGTYAYMAPESYTNSKSTQASDIYSLGVIFWEIFYFLKNKKYLKPYGEYRKLIVVEFSILMMAATNQMRPTIPNINDPVKNIISTLWAQEPENRPNINQVIENVDQITNAYNQAKGGGNDWNSLIK